MRSYKNLIVIITVLFSSHAWSQTLHDDWYIVHVGNIKWGYYNEKIEKDGDRLKYQQHYWKSEEGFINEEHLGAICMDNPELTPVLFNFHSNYRNTETTIDGSIQNENVLVVKIKKSGQELPLIKKGVPKKVFFSVFFPSWIHKNIDQIRTKKQISFNTILEDNIDLGFSIVPGIAKIQSPDDFSKKTKANKILIKYRGYDSIWWIDEHGSILRAEMPKQKITVEKVTQDKAKHFLENNK